MNIYARTRLRYSLVADDSHAVTGKPISIQLKGDLLQGNVSSTRTFARLVSPVNDISALGPKLNPNKIPPDQFLPGALIPQFDAARALAEFEKKEPRATVQHDQAMSAVAHENGPAHIHIEKTAVAGPYHLSVYLEGDYCPDHDSAGGGHDHQEHAATDPGRVCLRA